MKSGSLLLYKCLLLRLCQSSQSSGNWCIRTESLQCPLSALATRQCCISSSSKRGGGWFHMLSEDAWTSLYPPGVGGITSEKGILIGGSGNWGRKWDKIINKCQWDDIQFHVWRQVNTFGNIAQVPDLAHLTISLKYNCFCINSVHSSIKNTFLSVYTYLFLFLDQA